VNKVLYDFFIPIAKYLDKIFSPLLSLPSPVTVGMLSVLSTLFVVGLTRVLTDKNEYESLKKKSEELKERMVEAQKKNDEKEIEKVLDEMMKLNKFIVKNTVKTLLLSFTAAVLILPWLSFHYSGQAMFVLPVELPLIGNKINWLVWYILIGFISSLILNKLLGVKI